MTTLSVAARARRGSEIPVARRPVGPGGAAQALDEELEDQRASGVQFAEISTGTFVARFRPVRLLLPSAPLAEGGRSLDLITGLHRYRSLMPPQLERRTGVALSQNSSSKIRS